MIRLLTTATALVFTGLTVAQSLPCFGYCKFGEVRFGVAEPALPVPFMPLWATASLAATLWVVAYLMHSKES